MGYGALRRTRKKVRSTYFRIGTGSRQAGRHVKIDAVISRSEDGYGARACVVRHRRGSSGRSWNPMRCGEAREARTPTAALRKALRSLSSKKSLK